MNSDRFLMVGIGGVYNYGCEAIVRGTAAGFRAQSPETRLVYGSLRLDDDRDRLQGAEVELMDRGWREPLAHRAIRKALRKIGRPWYFSRDPVPKKKSYKGILSIGGDIYNMRPDGSYPGHLMKFGDALAHKRIPYIMWGCSMGPFDDAPPPARKAFLNHLKRVPAIVAREQVTIDYLKSVNYSGQLLFGADPAFLVAPDVQVQQADLHSRPRIALNLSPLSVLTLGFDAEETIQNQVNAAEQLAKRTGAKLILVPHVVCSFVEAMDDRRYLRRIHAQLQARGIDCEFVDADPGFVEIKRILTGCDLVIAARMHCAINAMTSAVPTILLSYSPKSVGVCEYVFYDRKNVFGLEAFGGEEFLLRVELLLNSKQQMVEFLKSRMTNVRSDAERPAAQVLEMVR